MNRVENQQRSQNGQGEWKAFWIFYALAVLFGFLILPFALTDTFANSAKALFSAPVPLSTSMVNGFRAVLHEPAGWAALIFLLIGPATPLIAAYITAAWRFGGPAVLEIISRYKPWRAGVTFREGATIWIVAMLVAFGMLVVTAVTRIYVRPSLGGPEYVWSPSGATISLFIVACLLAMFTDGGGVLEETGWRGFAQPLLQRRAGPVLVCALIGALWGLWHIPIKFQTIPTAWEAPGYFAVFYGIYIVGGAASAIIIGYFFNRAGGSTLIAIMLHGVQNDSMSLSGKLSQGPSPYASYDIGGLLIDMGTRIGPWIIVAILLIFLTKGRLGLRQGATLEAIRKA